MRKKGNEGIQKTLYIFNCIYLAHSPPSSILKILQLLAGEGREGVEE